ncbi:MAG TPA: AMP-binding protein [Steroidobacteraceae bacterium]|nr:AMP-binding protein [Steroidobacteraceae bacterium]
MLVIGDLARLNAQRYPRKPALILNGTALSYAELNTQANRLAHLLRAQGVGIGDRVALLSHNRLDYAVVTQAVAKAGALLVPMNFRFGAAEIRHVLADAEPKILVHEESFDAAVSAAIAAGAPAPQRLKLTESVGARELAQSHPACEPALIVDPASPCVIMYTSGTTGFPKGVLVSHATYFRMYLATAVETRMKHEEVYLIAVPLFHAAGLNMALHQCLFMGSTGIVHRGSFEPERIMQLIAAHRITLAILVPTTLALLAFHPRVAEFDLSSLEKIFYGSMPITPPALTRAREVFPQARFNQLYGSTESGMVSVLREEDHARWSQTTGRQALLTESRIVDESGASVPVGQVGEVIVNQRTMGMIGYWRNEEATRAAVRDGWIYTGDLARVEPEGLFTLVDRRHDVIISGGENIYPKEVENVIAAHPAVREVAVFGIPDELYGESVCAAVALWPERTASAEEIQEFCKSHLASYKRPRRIDFHAALPRNASDKVQKGVLRAPYRR